MRRAPRSRPAAPIDLAAPGHGPCARPPRLQAVNQTSRSVPLKTLSDLSATAVQAVRDGRSLTEIWKRSTAKWLGVQALTFETLRRLGQVSAPASAAGAEGTTQTGAGAAVRGAGMAGATPAAGLQRRDLGRPERARGAPAHPGGGGLRQRGAAPLPARTRRARRRGGRACPWVNSTTRRGGSNGCNATGRRSGKPCCAAARHIRR